MLKNNYIFRFIMERALIGSILTLLVGGSLNLTAQVYSTDDFHSLSVTRDSVYAMRSSAFEASVYRYMSSLNGVPPQAERAVLTIPVVVHIMHLPGDVTPDDATSNLTDQTVEKAILYLNQAFRNSGSYAGDPQFSNANIPSADVEIEFCLAQLDENGDPANGINRMATNLSNLYRDDDCPGGGSPQDLCLKSLSNWDSKQYLNIWVVNSICTTLNGDCLTNAYAYLPGAHGSAVDGIVIEADYFGSSPEATTELVHEAGHYLGLFNTYYQPSIAPSDCANSNCLAFGDGICDTPPDHERSPFDCSQGESQNSCSTDADDVSANNPFDSDVEDLFENFMDDGAPDCRQSFTPMQKVRMRFALTTERQSLLNSQACSSDFENIGFGTWFRPPTITCDSLIRPQIELYNSGETVVSSIDFWQRVDNFPFSTWTWNGAIYPGDTLILDLPAKFLEAGQHVWLVRIESINGVGPDDDESDDVKTLRFQRLEDTEAETNFPFCEDVEFGLNAYEQINWDGRVGFDFFPYSDCSAATGKFVMRYNTTGAWEGGAGIGAAPSGTRDALISKPFDLAGYNDINFSFVTAYKESFPDKALSMNVWVLPSCSDELVKVYSRSAVELESSTTPFNPSLTPWVPAGCDEWVNHSISLSQFAGEIVRVIIEVELEAEYSQNFYLDNFCIEASNVCPLPLAIPEKAGAFMADTACLAPDGWTHFWKYAATSPRTPQDVVLFSVYGLDSSSTNLLASDVSMIVTPSYGNGGTDMSDAPYVQNEEGWFVANRYWKLSPTVAGGDSLKVRVYFSEKDLDDLEAIAGSIPVGVPPMTVFRIGTDADPLNGHKEVTADKWGEFAVAQPGAGAVWQMQDFGGYFGAEFVLDQLDGLGIGISGEMKGLGPTYPANMTILDASQELGEISITWEVPRELLAKEFQIWRKGALESDFEMIGSRLSGGNSWESQVYSYVDPSPLEGPAEYFITLTHSVPLLGRSDTMSVSYNPAGLVLSYPNPTSGILRFRVDTEISEPVYAGIYNAGWQLLAEESWRNSPGEEIPMNLENFPPGIYFYVVRFMREGLLKEVRGKILLVPEG